MMKWFSINNNNSYNNVFISMKNCDDKNIFMERKSHREVHLIHSTLVIEEKLKLRKPILI